jgi:tetratricopeptide (TPR) repeat protein
MGLADLALPAQQAAARADPLSFIDRYNLALYNLVVKRYDLALAMAGEASALQPGNPELLSLECRIAAERRQLAAAHRVLTQLEAQATAGEPPADAVVCIFHIDVAERKLAEAHKLVDQAAASFPASGVSPTDIAIGYANTADISSAMTWFRRALALRDAQVLPVQYGNPELTKLYADPRWQAFRKEPAIRDWAAARTEIAAQFQIGE